MSTATTVIKEEVQKFSDSSKTWWEKSFGLIDLNNLRVPFARDSILETSGSAEAKDSKEPLKGFKIIDVGCGAGIFSEALAKLGALVTGIDASAELITAAKEHAKLTPSLEPNINYINVTSEEHVTNSAAGYDAVVCSEVIEHVDNKPFFVENLVKLTKPNGSLVITTLNKTWFSRIYSIFYLENITKFIPKGTHDYALFIAQEDLEKLLIKNGCEIKTVKGFNVGLNGKFRWTKSRKFWYAVHAIKKGSS